MTFNSEFYIFRDSLRRAPANEFVAELHAELSSLPTMARPEQLYALLLRAGELECGLSDGHVSPATCEQASCLTDLFAAAALTCDSLGSRYDSRPLIAAALPVMERLSSKQSIGVSVPEGFAYYALHPLDFADRAAGLHLTCTSALVIGIRSIGSTLSAVVTARLRKLGAAADRITVRPSGHPYDRVCGFDAVQRSTIARHLPANGVFFICDEGPGRSGSSLLSVAEALERAGVPPTRIRILCSHQPDVNALCARYAARRWQRYSSLAAGMTQRLPPDAAEPLAADGWRRKLLAEQAEWPAIWPQFERLAYASADGDTLLTFEGHGHYGESVCQRYQALSDAGFGLPYVAYEAGFGKHRAVEGRVARQYDLTPQLLTRMAEYCAWRARSFSVPDVGESDLETMARVNFEREFGVAPEGLDLQLVRPTICDANMLPQAWLQTAESGWLKLDAATHGDDHFFPGPCDIAWDLAGSVVEWELSEPTRELLLSQYRKASGDDVSRRIQGYELAYATFRMAWSRMAAASVGDPAEESRLMRDYRRYREFLRKLHDRALEVAESPDSIGVMPFR